jgi:hypothetical protein
MSTAKDTRKELIDFIDKNAFDVIIHTSPDKYKGQDREDFEDVLKKTKNEKRKFHDDYKTAKDVKENFNQDVNSEPAHKLDKTIKHLELPTLPEIKDEFRKLCDKLGV